MLRLKKITQDHIQQLVRDHAHENVKYIAMRGEMLRMGYTSFPEVPESKYNELYTRMKRAVERL